MEQYRSKLKLSVITDVISIIIFAFLSIVTFDAEIGISSALLNASWNSLTSGLCAGLGTSYLINLIPKIFALKDEKKLKKRYVKTHDERRDQIHLTASSTALTLALKVGIIATVIASNFSMTVGLTILVCLLAYTLLFFGCKFYYSKKF